MSGSHAYHDMSDMTITHKTVMLIMTCLARTDEEKMARHREHDVPAVGHGFVESPAVKHASQHVRKTFKIENEKNK